MALRLWFVMPDVTHSEQKTPLGQIIDSPEGHKELHVRLSKLAAARLIRG